MNVGDHVMYIHEDGHIEGFQIKAIERDSKLGRIVIPHGLNAIFYYDKCWDVEKLKTYLEQCRIRDGVPEPKQCPCGAKATHICECGILCCGEDQCIENCGGAVYPLKEGLAKGIKPREPKD